jgi:redox-sensitive bicupin YhaK (pirin superfamily)
VIEGEGVRCHLIMGEAFGAVSPVTQHHPTLYAALELTPGAAIELEREADERALYLLDGEASVDGEPLAPMHLVLLRPGTRPVLRSERGARLMICGGAPMDGKRHVWWNFVSSRQDRIQEASARGRQANSRSRRRTITNGSPS